jgi:hypothetical protein
MEANITFGQLLLKPAVPTVVAWHLFMSAKREAFVTESRLHRQPQAEVILLLSTS